MKYLFVRIAPINGESNGMWYLKPRSVDQVREHFNTVFGKEIHAGIRDKMYGNKHPDTAWRYAVDVTCSVKGLGWDCHGLPWLEQAVNLENQVLNGRIRDFEKGLDFYLPNSVQEFIPTWDRYEIKEKFESETLEYPLIEQYHVEDVRYMKWDMPELGVKGVHWYAKIGNEDVRDKNGNMKWNTKEEAEAAADWFCRQLNWKRNLHHPSYK